MLKRLSSLKYRYQTEIALLLRYQQYASRLAVFVIGLLTYGYTFFAFTYNNDAIGRIFYTNISFSYGIQIGRWMYAILSNIYFTAVRLPFLHGLFTVLLLCLCVSLLWKIFNITALVERILVGGAFMSVPLFIHFFYYVGDGEVYASGMLFAIFSLHCFARNTLAGYISAIILIACAFGCYPALFSFVTALYASYALHHYLTDFNIRKHIILFAKVTGTFLAGLLLYYLITMALLSLYDISIIAYKSSNEVTISQLLLRFPYKFLWTLFLFYKFLGNAGIWYLLPLSLAFIGLITIVVQKTRHWILHMFWFGLSVMVLCVLCLSTYLITFETGQYPGFLFGILILSSLPFAYVYRVEFKFLRLLIYCMAAFFILVNIKMNNQISLKYTFRLDAGKRLVHAIQQDILRHDAYEKQRTKIAFVGDLRYNSNYNIAVPLPNVRVMNLTQLVPVGFMGTDVPRSIANEMILQGVTIELVKQNELTDFTDHALLTAMPDYPEEGSIMAVNDVLIVNLGMTPDDTVYDPNRIEEKPPTNRFGRFLAFLKSKI